MKTRHTIFFSDARHMDETQDQSVDLIVTSPPYPMIEMWDSLFSGQDPAIRRHLAKGSGDRAFEGMHRILDDIWKECFRVLKPGGFACINIGDAVRTVNGNFSLYPNHARILSAARDIGFSSLPCILWRKQTNAPNKFMGSGMLPAGAYVTLEHEYILILRKGGKREFTRPEDKQRRRESALFWEERNQWFSDVWTDLKGTVQALPFAADRQRSAAFPLTLAWRLIHMYSAKADVVLDPFLGTGTTMAAAMAAGRSSVGYETDDTLAPAICKTAQPLIPVAGDLIRQRLADHETFALGRIAAKGPLKHTNSRYGFPVVTAQEKELFFSIPNAMSQPGKDMFEVTYGDGVHEDYIPRDWEMLNAEEPVPENAGRQKRKKKRTKSPGMRQGELF